MKVINPARLSEVVGEVAMFTDTEVDTAILVAQRGFEDWARTPVASRARCLREAAAALRQRLPELTRLFVRENGKPLAEAERDLRRSIELTELVAQELPQWWQPEQFDSNQPVWARRRARGVTAVISPWNSPVLLSFKRFIPSIAAGNPTIIKPATYCPLTVIECVKTMAEFLPEGVIRVVTGNGGTVGEQLASDERIRSVAFTGSTETGRRIMGLASRTLKKVFLELGGNDPALVLDDANLDGAAIQKMTNAILRASGQVCVAIKRIYVHESRHDELVEKLGAAFDSVVVGDGLQAETTMGPLNNKPQFDFVNGLIERCRKRDLQILVRGKSLAPDKWSAGYFMLPSIVLGAGNHDDIVICEQFGPVIPILKFSSEDDAISRANATEFGLRASVWTSDPVRAAAIADRLQAGAVFYNGHGIFQDLHLEFPGIKQSGLSRESRHAGLDHYADIYGFAE